jgi:aspartate/methionine/tyrosine aminotransferase
MAALNPLAQELNGMIEAANPHVLEMLSDLGKRMFFPKGILSQSAEAKQKAHKFNASIGIALENGAPMYLPCVHKYFNGLDPKDLYPYATHGKPELRKRWREKILVENPKLNGKTLGMPIVTSGVTSGLSLVADLFVDPGDVIVLPDLFWGNYRLTFAVRAEGEIKTFPTYDERGAFNVAAFKETLLKEGKRTGKLVVLMNFPNNPAGYMINLKEANGIHDAILAAAKANVNIVAVTDDAYFGLVYDEHALQESVFGWVANLHERVLAIKLDGATKEEFVWGFRTGFMTYAPGGKATDELLTALEKKTMGDIRASISNCPHPSQTIVLKALDDPQFPVERKQKFVLMKARADAIHEVLKDPKFGEVMTMYPFNAGYFMCLKLKTVEAEPLRVHLLDKYGVGLISMGKVDLRIAFSCLEVEQIPEMFEIIYKGIKDLEG